MAYLNKAAFPPCYSKWNALFGLLLTNCCILGSFIHLFGLFLVDSIRMTFVEYHNREHNKQIGFKGNGPLSVHTCSIWTSPWPWPLLPPSQKNWTNRLCLTSTPNLNKLASSLFLTHPFHILHLLTLQQHCLRGLPRAQCQIEYLSHRQLHAAANPHSSLFLISMTFLLPAQLAVLGTPQLHIHMWPRHKGWSCQSANQRV